MLFNDGIFDPFVTHLRLRTAVGRASFGHKPASGQVPFASRRCAQLLLLIAETDAGDVGQGLVIKRGAKSVTVLGHINGSDPPA